MYLHVMYLSSFKHEKCKFSLESDTVHRSDRVNAVQKYKESEGVLMRNMNISGGGKRNLMIFSYDTYLFEHAFINYEEEDSISPSASFE